MKKKRNKKLRKKLTQKLLKEYLHYNPDTGIFTWRVDRRGKAKAGKFAGCLDNGYLRIRLFGKLYKAHRLAWLYMTGEWPKDQIDHEDGDGLNNRWKNLRGATNGVNSKNQKKRINNSSGATGVYKLEGVTDKWRVRIWANGEQIDLGCHDYYDEAVLIRIQAQEYYGFHENHGRV